MSATTLNTARPDWYPGQVTVNSQSDFRIVLEGKATNGGFAVDQLVFNTGKARITKLPGRLSVMDECRPHM